MTTQLQSFCIRILQVKPLLNFKQCKKRLTWTTQKRYWTVGQWSKVTFSDESKFCISLGNRGPRVWRKPYKADKPSIKFPQCTMVWGGTSTAGVGFCIFCEQMSLLLSIKKSWSIFYFRQLSNCLKVTSFYSNTTWLLFITANPLRLKPYVVYRVWDTGPVLANKLSVS